MKLNLKAIVAALFLFGTTWSQAQATPGWSSSGTTPPQQQQQQQQQSSSSSEAAATNAGNSQSIIFTSPENSVVKQSGDVTNRVVYSGSQKVKNVPSVSGPALTSSNDTCMGSVSGSVNVAGFGAGVGSTYRDMNCIMLKNSRELWNMGMRGAALARMCGDLDNREALEITGFTCPQTEREQQAAAASAATQNAAVPAKK